MDKILDGKKCSQAIYKQLIPRINHLKEQGINPSLSVILVGNNPASSVYVSNKEKKAQELGIDIQVIKLEDSITEQELVQIIQKLNTDNTIHGILVQSPLPKHIDAKKIIATISPNKDVDGFHPLNIGNLMENNLTLVPCTPYGIIELLKFYDIDISSKHCVVIGRSSIVGKPISTLLLHDDATVTICHSKTKNISNILKLADIIIVAVGQAYYLKDDMINENGVLIDVGMNRIASGLVGDIDPKCYEKAKCYTPVPGGVGPMTIAMLMQQVVSIAENEELK